MGSDSDSAGGGAATTSGAAWATPDGKVPSSSMNRPSELSLDDVNPCDLLTKDQRGKFGLAGEQASKLSSTWSTNSCTTWDADKVLSTSVTAVSTDGIEIFYRGRFTNMQYKPTVVRGFPALFYRFDNAEHACYLAVDVADGQLVDVAYGASDPESSDASQDEVCDTAFGVTEAAMDTLLSSQQRAQVVWGTDTVGEGRGRRGGGGAGPTWPDATLTRRRGRNYKLPVLLLPGAAPASGS